jgi:hypothetical protein
MRAAWALRRNGTNRRIPRSIGAPPQALGLGDTCTTGLRLRTRRFATVEAATRLARLRFERRLGRLRRLLLHLPIPAIRQKLRAVVRQKLNYLS